MEYYQYGRPMNPELTFEDFKNENGITFWYASDLALMLGYSNLKSFQNVLNKTTKAFMSLNIPHHDNIILCEREFGEDTVKDFKLTRFACYLSAMNADPKKPEVALAQAYFAEKTRQMEIQIQASEEIDRLVIRDELAEGNRAMNAAAKNAGVEDYAKFMNAGYRGMYNMFSFQLEERRGVKHGLLFEYMGRTELAANLFRVTQTEEAIKNRRIGGQKALEDTHEDVGREVRRIVLNNTGKSPENLPQARKLNDVRKDLKQGHKKMLKADSSSTKPKRGKKD